jgi:hypothetical protein
MLTLCGGWCEKKSLILAVGLSLGSLELLSCLKNYHT